MITRSHQTGTLRSEAQYSDCESYRYRLSRRWGTGGTINFIMLNPSVADECRNDPTVERCERRARSLGFGAFVVTNIFAWRDTDPRAMRRAAQPIGPENDAVLIAAAKDADLVIAAWGVHGAHWGRGRQVTRLLLGHGVGLHHLGLSKDGNPRHPLYVAYAQNPLAWAAPDMGPG